ncbi:acyltransferase [Undibacterium sp. Jales W-56]|uniref:acyltransferase family protein n=1 Tax=Undibacterium sp. Jales W-56 TaxID=2897325 RepID=UPI0021CE392E|nr:acyltransferase [Undibacterium sp. Jales W-56]MCU6434917.1 acyltransferase [Undibacterium sp. Jales W-56]
MTNSLTLPYRITRVPELDGLRGIAILLVMLFHMDIGIFNGGFIGVDIFFVLSGFLITSLLLKERSESSGNNLQLFYFRRFLRLVPGYLLLLLIYVLVNQFYFTGDERRSHVIDAAISLAWLSNWARAFGVHPPSYLGHTWSLSVEAQFYFIWPILLGLIANIAKPSRNLAKIILLFVLCIYAIRVYFIVSGATVDRLYNGLDTRADALLVGCCLSAHLSSQQFEKTKMRIYELMNILLPVSVLYLTSACILLSWMDLSLYYYHMLLIEISVAILIVAIFLQKSELLRKILTNPVLVWIGSISYGLYLWHYPVYAFLRTMGYGQTSVVLAGSGLTFLAAFLSFRYIEKPLILWGAKSEFTSRETAHLS